MGILQEEMGKPINPLIFPVNIFKIHHLIAMVAEAEIDQEIMEVIITTIADTEMLMGKDPIEKTDRIEKLNDLVPDQGTIFIVVFDSVLILKILAETKKDRQGEIEEGEDLHHQKKELLRIGDLARSNPISM